MPRWAIITHEYLNLLRSFSIIHRSQKKITFRSFKIFHTYSRAALTLPTYIETMRITFKERERRARLHRNIKILFGRITHQSRDYHYTPLQEGETRLLRLLPPSKNNPTKLRGELFNVLMDEAPAYEALSYTWGTEKGDDFIAIDNARLPVTSNLAAALQVLQYPDKSLQIRKQQIKTIRHLTRAIR